MITGPFLDYATKFVWKIKVRRAVCDGMAEEFYTGVCISVDGTILTGAYYKEGVQQISVYDSHAHEYRASVISHSYGNGLALLRVEEKKSFDFVEISGSTEFYIGEEFYAVLYHPSHSSFNPIPMKGYLANICKSVGCIKGYDFANQEALDFSVPVLQIANLGLRTAKVGCPLFDTSGILAGVLAFQKSAHDFAIHAKFIKDFVSECIPLAGREERVEEKEKGSEEKEK